MVEGLHGRLDQDPDADGDRALVDVEGGGVDVEVGPGDADAQAGHGAGDLLQVPGEVLPAHALGALRTASSPMAVRAAVAKTAVASSSLTTGGAPLVVEAVADLV